MKKFISALPVVIALLLISTPAFAADAAVSTLDAAKMAAAFQLVGKI
jgi:hypothetical protein